MNDTNERQVLDALFRMSRSNQPITSERLAQEARLSPTQSAVALVALDRWGLVDLWRLRLTMPGLVVAAGLEHSPLPALDRVAARPAAHGFVAAA